jgi:ribosomal protein S18 acetylase RimI-like enzyme
MTIAELTAGHRADAVALWLAAGLTRPWNDPVADLDRALAGPSSTVLAALGDDGGLVGTVMVGHDGHRGWLYYLAVDEARRGEGIGRALVAAAEAWVADAVPKVQLMIRADNVAAVAFYERLGYERSDVTVLGRRPG